MTFSRLRDGTKSYGLERKEIEEGTLPFSLYQGGRKGMRTLHREREYSESKSRVLDFEDICWMGDEKFTG
jgi:hypothetical protein